MVALCASQCKEDQIPWKPIQWVYFPDLVDAKGKKGEHGQRKVGFVHENLSKSGQGS